MGNGYDLSAHSDAEKEIYREVLFFRNRMTGAGETLEEARKSVVGFLTEGELLLFDSLIGDNLRFFSKFGASSHPTTKEYDSIWRKIEIAGLEFDM